MRFVLCIHLHLCVCVFAEGEAEAEAAVKAELSEETGLVEEDLVAVSYMGDELDLETVGDIIAIIEEKVQSMLCQYVTSFSILLCLVDNSHWKNVIT